MEYKEVLPKLNRLPLVLDHPRSLLTVTQRAELDEHLANMARTRERVWREVMGGDQP